MHTVTLAHGGAVGLAVESAIVVVPVGGFLLIQWIGRRREQCRVAAERAAKRAAREQDQRPLTRHAATRHKRKRRH